MEGLLSLIAAADPVSVKHEALCSKTGAAHYWCGVKGVRSRPAIACRRPGRS